MLCIGAIVPAHGPLPRNLKLENETVVGAGVDSAHAKKLLIVQGGFHVEGSRSGATLKWVRTAATVSITSPGT